MQIIRYTVELQETWDAFIDCSKNGTFLLKRGYMDYHSDRFEDFSLLFYQNDKLIALLPANRSGEVLYSHQGLTYGGLLLSRETTAVQVLQLFGELISFLAENGMTKFIYKPIPYIYHNYPSEEDLYALFRNGAVLQKRLISSVIDKNDAIPFSRIRNRHVRKAQGAGMIVCPAADYLPFWQVLSGRLLDKYGVSPVHSVEEITLLASRFPDNLRLFEARIGEEIVGGCVVFIMKDLVHIQYSSATEKGMELGALDLLFDFVANIGFPEKRYIDIGTSNEEDGWVMNEKLMFRKETCGGRAVVYDTYELNIV